MITASHLTKVFGTVTAIDDVSFHVDCGEVVGFLGPNGAGKTTTMRILAGVFPPTSGAAAVAGRDVIDEGMAARRAVGYVPEYAPLYPDQTVEQYLHFVGRLKRLPRRARDRGVADALSSCGLDGVARRLIGALSKGYRQRVGIAQALLGDPPVLILDEPTIGLDPEQVLDVRTLVSSLGAARAVLFSSHILSEVESVCSRVIVIDRGRVVAEGTPAALMTAVGARHRITVRVDGPRELVVAVCDRGEAFRVLEVTEESGRAVRLLVETDDGDAGSRELSRAIQARGWALLELRHEAVQLEDIFLRLVQKTETRS
jgi:ABC-2 type transport system ATP-binding protein